LGIKKETLGPNGEATIYLGDCLEILPTLTGVDAVVTDPPYGMKNNVDSSRFTRRRGHGGRFKEMIANDDRPFDPTPYLRFNEVIMFGANHYAKRLPIGTTLVWLKRFDGAFGSFLSDAEIAWQKGGCGVYAFRDLSMTSQALERKHPNQKPLPLMSWCVERVRGATILDPFMGSGTTGVACANLGRRFIGIEIEPKYYDIARKRISDAYAQGRLFDAVKENPIQQGELIND